MFRLGVFLSGGLDSSSIVYWISRNLDKQVKTFSAGFTESSFNELAYARHLAESLNTDHHECIVDADAINILPKIVWHAEEPTVDSSMVALYRLSHMAKDYVKMVLTRDGADEILADYETYQAYFVSKLCRLFPLWPYRHLIMPLIISYRYRIVSLVWILNLSVLSLE